MADFLCQYCRQPFDDWDNVIRIAKTRTVQQERYDEAMPKYTFHQSFSAMRASADNGCLFCYMFLGRYYQRSSEEERQDSLPNAALWIDPALTDDNHSPVDINFDEWLYALSIEFEGCLLVDLSWIYICPIRQQGNSQFQVSFHSRSWVYQRLSDYLALIYS